MLIHVCIFLLTMALKVLLWVDLSSSQPIRFLDVHITILSPGSALICVSQEIGAYLN